MIDEATLIEAIIDTRAQVDFLWQFFVTVQIALFALFFIYTSEVERLTLPAKVFALAGVGLFEFINGSALINAYEMIDAMMEQYRFSYGQIDRFLPVFYERFVLLDYANRPNMVWAVHLTAFSVSLLALLARDVLHRQPQ